MSRDQAVLLTDPSNPDAPKQPETSDQSRLEDRWILSRLYATANAVNSALEIYRFDEAAHAIYQFFWGDLCDWYLELVKLRIESGESDEQDRLVGLPPLQWRLRIVAAHALALHALHHGRDLARLLRRPARRRAPSR